MMMKISELKAGLRISERKNNGDIQHFEVVNVQPAGRRVEVTFRSHSGMESALYPADAYLSAY
ncbi:hypothetical protein [Craterilacuibacter sp. RT1T]|uniref:hypothetical protein n=1 Tax=Craterilacuibacter sp. RT1T TaxID=2942211 RepID=UPI0020BDF852|nr:hypothetical protein [Craterilacuibacter sp. RT1T]MCL6264712.1 hypothetical protein [Craterilacuibacter sp. RT1T]